MKKTVIMILTLVMILSLFSACTSKPAPAPAAPYTPVEAAVVEAPAEEAAYLAETTIYLDAAASMTNAFNTIIEMYKEVQPNVAVVANYGSSGTLLTQIEESKGIDHDIFFSAGKNQVKTLDETDGLVVEGSIVELLGNALVLATYNGSETAVTAWDNLDDAASMALCDGTVPVGQYTRKLLVAKGILPEAEDVNAYTSAEISAALNGLEINECADVSAAAAAVEEMSNEIGTMYYTDYYSYRDSLTIIDMDENGEFTGAIIYPVCQVANPEATEEQLAAVADFLAYIQSDEILSVFGDYCFVVRQGKQ